jgi:hemoglobin-like flavoprotein
MIEQDKINYVKVIFPQLSKKGQKYLQRIAEAMLFIQDPALSPIYADQEERKENDGHKE